MKGFSVKTRCSGMYSKSRETIENEEPLARLHAQVGHAMIFCNLCEPISLEIMKRIYNNTIVTYLRICFQMNVMCFWK